MDSLAERVVERYDTKRAYVFEALGYDSVHIAVRGMKQANGLKPTAVRDEISNGEYENGAAWPAKFGSTGRNIWYQQTIAKWLMENGELQNLPRFKSGRLDP